MLRAPRPEITLTPLHLRAFAALADGAVAHGADHGRVQVVVPEALTDGCDLDAMGHG